MSEASSHSRVLGYDWDTTHLNRRNDILLSPLQSLIQSGTKLWLDSIDPDLVAENRRLGATGATSNPVIVSDLIKTGRFDERISELVQQGLGDSDLAWQLTDELVQDAQQVFLPVWEETNGNDGYVSFEVDPLLEDPELDLPHDKRVQQYIELGTKWAAGHKNRMIKVPATAAGLDALEGLAARGITLNVTLIFTSNQYEAARDAVWRGAQRFGKVDAFKSVYSIFISRIDVYSEKHAPQLSADAQGQVGIVNAKRIWQANQDFWSDKNLPLQQEMIFASTGTKKPSDPAWKYVAALAGSDIQTNPPSTNDAINASDQTFTRQVDVLPSDDILSSIDTHVDFQHLHDTLISEGIQKFADPQKALRTLIANRRALVVNA